ncbi:MAG: adenosylmethionine decarboxylase [candidate division Zixibacteria bacterium]|nr:adenosylmethionine decarboxylase [candidate division Zixibacteria bacterium]
MKILGRHLIVEFVDCDREILDDSPALEEFMNEAVRRSGATIVRSVFHRYNPHGVSGVVVIAESHLSIHSWPEYGYAAVDFFTCGESVDPYKAFEYMRSALKAGNVTVTDLKRGIPSEFDEVINHKPVLLTKTAVS